MLVATYARHCHHFACYSVAAIRSSVPPLLPSHNLHLSSPHLSLPRAFLAPPRAYASCRVFNKVETVELMRRRVSEFSRWLRHRDEPMIVAFGHSTFWKYFANTKTRLRNCEVLQFWW